MSYELVNPEELGEPRGWTNGMLAAPGGRLLFVAGQDAAEPGGEVTTDDFVQQFRIALAKALAVVAAAGGTAQDVGRITIFVTDVDAYHASRKEIGVAYRVLMGKHFPAMALLEVKGLVDPRARVELELTAVIHDGSGSPESPAAGE